MKVTLNNGTVFQIDKKDWIPISGITWFSNGSYPYTSVDGKTVYLHRLVMRAPAGLEVDHINGDRLDNRRKNLRLATRSQNEANKGVPARNTSGFKGVSLFKPTGRFSAYIEVNQKKRHLGYYTTAKEAALAYNRAAVDAFGEFARLNKVGGE